MAHEINLVPDIKGEMIKTLKLRNLTLFICIIVASASVAVTVIFGLIMGGQQIALNNKKTTLDTLSTKLNSYSDLNDFLTIKNQLGNLANLSENKKVLSRTFGILTTLLPTGADTVTTSKVDVDLSSEQPTISLDAQANAGTEPFIDYNVLDSFKKSMKYMRYDYGHYVDKKGETIPAYCMIESGDDGATFKNDSGDIYAFWTINAKGCKPSSDTKESDYSTEDYNGTTVVRIWRTPQYKEWYKEKQVEGQPYMSLDGQISGVEHFESACITYTGNASNNSSSPKWISANESCLLVPNGDEGIAISDSSNGRDSNGELVLHFAATISLSPEVYKFKNTHMMTLPSNGRRNVTDSYSQIQAMFSERAKDCDKNDLTCSSNTNNVKGEE